MNKSIIKVQFADRYREGEFGKQEYTYYLDAGLTVQVGQIITVPTKFGHTRARVSKVNVSERAIDMRWADSMKTVTAADLEETPRPSSEPVRPSRSTVHPSQQSFFSDRELSGDYGYTMEGDMS